MTRHRRINPETEAKARAWEKAAAVVQGYADMLCRSSGYACTADDADMVDHFDRVIVPSLRRRADIIRRNGRKR